jgi:hypothetical protein
MKFLPPDKMVQNLQIAVYGVLGGLAFLTYIISPPQGTMWYIVTGSLGLPTSCSCSSSLQHRARLHGHLQARCSPFSGQQPVCSFSPFFALPRPQRRLSNDLFGLQDSPTMLSILVVVYSVLLIMYFELSNGVIRYSMLDTSIRTNEVYVMNPKKIVSKYHRSLVINPVLATLPGLVRPLSEHHLACDRRHLFRRHRFANARIG